MQAAIQRLFDMSTMPEDSAFHDFVGALYNLSLEMVSMQSGVGAGGGYSKCEHECYEPRHSRTERFSRRRVSGIHIPRTLVHYIHLPCLLQLRERSEQRSGDLGICRYVQYSTSHVSAT
jgi:hypothetical protein